MKNIIKFIKNFILFFTKHRKKKRVKNILVTKNQKIDDELIDKPSSIRGRFPRGEYEDNTRD